MKEAERLKDCAIEFWIYWEALEDATVKVLRLTEEAVFKYQRVTRFVIGPHAIHVQVRRDYDKKWLPITYKVSNIEMETIIADWPQEWHEPISLNEVLTSPPTDAPVDPLPDPSSDHDSDEVSTRTPTDSDTEWKFEESRTKKRQDWGATNSNKPISEEQLIRIIAAITTMTDAARE